MSDVVLLASDAEVESSDSDVGAVESSFSLRRFAKALTLETSIVSNDSRPAFPFTHQQTSQIMIIMVEILRPLRRFQRG